MVSLSLSRAQQLYTPNTWRPTALMVPDDVEHQQQDDRQGHRKPQEQLMADEEPGGDHRHPSQSIRAKMARRTTGSLRVRT